MNKLSSLEKVLGSVSRETFDSLVELERQLGIWNARINLVADTTVKDAWTRHILDSAQLLRISNARKWADLGSGGGFPGLVIANLLRERGGSIDLIESNTKKTSFLNHIIGLQALPGAVHSQRIEDAVRVLPAPEIITARALAALPKLLTLAEPWLTQGSVGLFHKGREYRQEVEESADKFAFNLIEHRSLVDADSVILEVSGFSRRS